MKKLYKLLLVFSAVLMVACGEEKNSNVGTTSKNYSSLGLPIYYDKIIDSNNDTTSELYEFTSKEKGIIAVTLRSTYKGYDIGRLIYGIDLIEEIPHKISIKYGENNKGFITFSWNEAYMTIPFIVEYDTPKVMQPSSKRDSFLETMYNDIKKEKGEKVAKEAMKEYYNTTLEPQFFINNKKVDFDYIRDTVEGILDISGKDSKKISFNMPNAKVNSNNSYKYKDDILKEKDENLKKTENIQYDNKNNLDNNKDYLNEGDVLKKVFENDNGSLRYRGNFIADVEESHMLMIPTISDELAEVVEKFTDSEMLYAHMAAPTISSTVSDLADRLDADTITKSVDLNNGVPYYQAWLFDGSNQVAFIEFSLDVKNKKDGQTITWGGNIELIVNSKKGDRKYTDVDAVSFAQGY